MRLSKLNRRRHQLLESIVNLYYLTEEQVQPQPWLDEIMRGPKIANWLRSQNINGQIGQPMASGSGRAAYPVGDNIVVKLTTDTKEARAAAIMKGHDSPHAANIHDVRRVGTFQHPTENRRVDLYAITMERLNTGVGKKMRMAGNAVYDYLDHNNKPIGDVEEIVQEVISKYLDKRYANDQGVIYAIRQIVSGLHDVQQRTGVTSQDPHGANIALKNRKPAFFDFGRSKVDYDHPKAQDARITALS